MQWVNTFDDLDQALAAKDEIMASPTAVAVAIIAWQCDEKTHLKTGSIQHTPLCSRCNDYQSCLLGRTPLYAAQIRIYWALPRSIIGPMVLRTP